MHACSFLIQHAALCCVCAGLLVAQGWWEALQHQGIWILMARDTLRSAALRTPTQACAVWLNPSFGG